MSEPLLVHGSTGDYVVYCQQLLDFNGVSPGAADGTFGRHTEEAVRSFQAAHPPLAVDGKVGRQTWAALKGEPIPASGNGHGGGHDAGHHDTGHPDGGGGHHEPAHHDPAQADPSGAASGATQAPHLVIENVYSDESYLKWQIRNDGTGTAEYGTISEWVGRHSDSNRVGEPIPAEIHAGYGIERSTWMAAFEDGHIQVDLVIHYSGGTVTMHVELDKDGNHVQMTDEPRHE